MGNLNLITGAGQRTECSYWGRCTGLFWVWWCVERCLSKTELWWDFSSFRVHIGALLASFQTWCCQNLYLLSFLFEFFLSGYPVYFLCFVSPGFSSVYSSVLHATSALPCALLGSWVFLCLLDNLMVSFCCHFSLLICSLKKLFYSSSLHRSSLLGFVLQIYDRCNVKLSPLPSGFQQKHEVKLLYLNAPHKKGIFLLFVKIKTWITGLGFVERMQFEIWNCFCQTLTTLCLNSSHTRTSVNTVCCELWAFLCLLQLIYIVMDILTLSGVVFLFLVNVFVGIYCV